MTEKPESVLLKEKFAADFYRDEISLNGNVVSWSEYIQYLDGLLERKLNFGEQAVVFTTTGAFESRGLVS